jgi:hypothetical protein
MLGTFAPENMDRLQDADDFPLGRLCGSESGYGANASIIQLFAYDASDVLLGTSNVRQFPFDTKP